MIIDDGTRQWCYDGVTVFTWQKGDPRYPTTFTNYTGGAPGFSGQAFGMMMEWLEEIGSAEYLDWVSS